MDEQKKVVWPGWTVGHVIGQGGFGKVYEIHRDNFGNTERAALKVITIPQSQHDIDELYNDGYDSQSITLRFRSYLESIVHEYSLMQELKGNTNIVYCDDLRYIQHDDGIGWDIYIKMELLTPLMKALSTPITDAQVIHLGMDICNALMLCKNRGIIHRDIKPQNIFVSKDGDFKLGDFGIAKITERTTSGTKVGTYKYMAPEVYHNQPYGSAADIYSLGLVMYWMLNERRTPFLPLPPRVPTVTMEDEARNRRLAGERLPAPARGCKELQRIVLKACAADLKERYRSAAEMQEDLEALLRQMEGTIPLRMERRNRIPEEDVTLKLSREADLPHAAELTQGLFPKRNALPEERQLDETVCQRDATVYQTQLDRRRNPEDFQMLHQEQTQNQSGRNKILAIVGILLVLVVVVFAGKLLLQGETGPEDAETVGTVEIDEVASEVTALLKQLNMYYHDGDTNQQRFFYDAEGRLTESIRVFTHSDGETSEYRTRCVYNAQGWLTRQENTENNGSSTTAYEWEYNENGAVTVFRSYANGHLMEETAYEYDEKGNRIRENGNGNSGMEYDDQGRVIAKRMEYGGDYAGAFVDTTYSYDAQGRLAETRSVSDFTALQGLGYKEEGHSTYHYDYAPFTLVKVYHEGKFSYMTLELPDSVLGDVLHSPSLDENAVFMMENGYLIGVSGEKLDVEIEYAIPSGESEETAPPEEPVKTKYQQTQEQCEAMAAEGQYRKAIQTLDEAWKTTGEASYLSLAGDYRMKFGIHNTAYIAAGKYNSVVVLDDGRVVVAGDDEYGELDAKYWSDIIAVSAGDRHTVGLRANGTVVSVGDNEQGQCATGSWSNVVAISAGDVHTVALLENGTLLAAGQQWAPRCDMAGLYNKAAGKRIVAVAAGYVHTLALLEDGTVIAVGENGNKQCEVDNWTDIAAIYAGTYYSLGLKTDGSVVVAGYTDWNIAGWTDMINLAAGDYFVVGITSEHTILSAGMQRDIGPNTPNTISFWKDIVLVSAGHDHIVTITGDGKSKCAGRDELGQIYLDGFSVDYPRIDDCIDTKEMEIHQKKNYTDVELMNLVVEYFQENMDSGYEGNYVAFADELFEDKDRGRLCVVVRFQRTDAYATTANTLAALVSVDQVGDLFVDGAFLGNLFDE